MKNYIWINEPAVHKEDNQTLSMQTETQTDMWQRTHYGFSRNNAPMYLTHSSDQGFVYQVQTKFASHDLYDQCGIIIYLDENNWAKFSSEYENTKFQRLGGVVTKQGYSDWATQDIPANITSIRYQVTREANDFIVAYAFKEAEYHQLRVFNLALNEPLTDVRIGLYACSPQGQGFTAEFVNPHFN
ncbi:DUF1349 domain-containing protein [Oenococcus kitaharae]|uniref:DUF1349 domain-containing protein n=1 Tax=Oenococcus TaxID=46254 RepID=UPI0021E80CCA|nr:DUF1349 domain-containing protein [Oenococcus kitaharae]MCV3296170.1 DUF1349 domain-containing protein [Oenococcus kitaharae]